MLRQPGFSAGLASLLTDEHVPAWRDWLCWQVIHSAAGYLSEAFVAAVELGSDKMDGHIKKRKQRGEFLEFCRSVRSLRSPDLGRVHMSGLVG